MTAPRPVPMIDLAGHSAERLDSSSENGHTAKASGRGTRFLENDRTALSSCEGCEPSGVATVIFRPTATLPGFAGVPLAFAGDIVLVSVWMFSAEAAGARMAA